MNVNEQIYRYTWKNNSKRETLYGRECRLLGVMKKNSVVIEFLDNGQKEIVSRQALRKVKDES